MQFAVLILAILALFAALYTEANPQNFKIQRLPYYPPPTAAPRYIRVRRGTELAGSASTNSKCGVDESLELIQSIAGDEEHNLVQDVHAAGNTQNDPVVAGASLAYNTDGHGQVTRN